MIIFRTGGEIASGPFWATVEEVIWFSQQVDMVLGYVSEDSNTSFSVPIDTNWLDGFLSEMYPQREMMAHVVEWTDGHSELALGGWVTGGPTMAVAGVLRAAPEAHARGELFGYVQLNRRDGVAVPLTPERLEHMLGEYMRGHRVYAKLYDRTTLIVGGEADYP